MTAVPQPLDEEDITTPVRADVPDGETYNDRMRAAFRALADQPDKEPTP